MNRHLRRKNDSPTNEMYDPHQESPTGTYFKTNNHRLPPSIMGSVEGNPAQL